MCSITVFCTNFGVTLLSETLMVTRGDGKQVRYDSRFTLNPRSGGVRCDLIELRPMDASVSWNTSFPT